MKYKSYLVITSLLAAILLWMIIRLFTVTTSTIILPINNDSLNMFSTIKQQPIKLEIVLQGTGYNIIKFYFSNRKLSYMHNNPNTISDVVDVSDLAFNNASALNIHSIKLISDKSLSKTMESKELKIELIFSDDDAKRFYMTKSFKLSQSIVKVKGPSTELSKINSVKTSPINLKQLEEDRFQINLINPNPALILSTYFVEAISNHKQLYTRVFLNIPISDDERYSFYPSSITIRVASESDDINRMTENDFKVLADVSSIASGYGNLNIIIPDKLLLLEYTPLKVRISLKK